ncbi:MAG: type II toxin-antitoxin system Phd/YefM family antitoxin [Anaerolineaceae bacterium]|nr:type II toxin-antitoxin system Phd/YefM family antitoxin [Anaerolineaceae bacterium]
MHNIWQLQNAKSKFSELVERTLAYGPQIITKRGVKTVVVMTYDEYKKLKEPQGKFSQFMLNSPLAGSQLLIEREKDLPRDIEIDQ